MLFNCVVIVFVGVAVAGIVAGVVVIVVVVVLVALDRYCFFVEGCLSIRFPCARVFLTVRAVHSGLQQAPLATEIQSVLTMQGQSEPGSTVEEDQKNNSVCKGVS